jgi:hypothetical protein
MVAGSNPAGIAIFFFYQLFQVVIAITPNPEGRQPISLVGGCVA